MSHTVIAMPSFGIAGATFWFWIIAAYLSSAICGALWKCKPLPGKYL